MSALELRGLRELFKEPTWPTSVGKPPAKSRLGIDYDSSWARKPAARAARYAITEGLTRPLTRVVTSLEVHGAKELDEVPAPVIFVANHSSHLDTGVIITALPARYRKRTVVAAAADYFFDREWKADVWALLLAAIPIERQRISRKFFGLAEDLLSEGWSVLIFPEGGRTPDGWAQEFHPASAAYLAKRSGVAVVPIHLRGVRPVFPRGSGKLRPGKVEVRFGAPMQPRSGGAEGDREEDARHFSARLEAAVSVLADEAETDWWSARQRAAKHATPPLGGPSAAPWRRTWALPVPTG